MISEVPRDCMKRVKVVDWKVRVALVGAFESRMDTWAGWAAISTQLLPAKVLELLGLRGIPVPASVRERVNACSDLDLLNTWFKRTVHAENAEDLFVDD
jgi:hypothetical protein